MSKETRKTHDQLQGPSTPVSTVIMHLLTNIYNCCTQYSTVKSSDYLPTDHLDNYHCSIVVLLYITEGRD